MPPPMLLNEIKGQEHVKRAVEVALAGEHSILFVGPPGNGKSEFEKVIERIDTAVTTFSCWPCGCGFHGDPGKECVCTSDEVRRVATNLGEGYEIIVEVPRVPWKDLISNRQSDSGNSYGCLEDEEKLAERVLGIADKRFELKSWHSLNDECQRALEMVCDKLCYSARKLTNVIEVGITIAALAGKKKLNVEHITEAIAYSKYRKGC